MIYSFSIWLIVLGMLAASNLIIARKPDAKEIIAKFAPYQGWMGAVSVFYGAWGVVSSLSWMGTYFMHGVSSLAVSVLMIALGLLLGVGTLKTFIKSPAATEKLDTAVAKLAPFQGTLGLIGMGLGAFGIVSIVLF